VAGKKISKLFKRLFLDKTARRYNKTAETDYRYGKKNAVIMKSGSKRRRFYSTLGIGSSIGPNRATGCPSWSKQPK
jgi:hypothetical protein